MRKELRVVWKVQKVRKKKKMIVAKALYGHWFISFVKNAVLLFFFSNFVFVFTVELYLFRYHFFTNSKERSFGIIFRDLKKSS